MHLEENADGLVNTAAYPFGVRIWQRSDVQFVLFLLACIAFFAAIKTLLLNPAGNARNEPVFWIGCALILLTTFHVRMADLPPVMAIILRFQFVMFGVYLAFPVTLWPEPGLPALTQLRLYHGHWVLPVMCLLGFWRPGIAAVAAVALWWQRSSLSEVFGGQLARIEYFPLIEVTIFLVLSAAVAPLARTGPLRRASEPMAVNDTLGLLEKMTLCGIAVHLSNYFHSGLKKIGLGDHSLSWVLHNDTSALLLASWTSGHLPLAFSDALAGASFLAMTFLLVPLNALTLLSQLAAIVSVVRTRWIAWLTAFYDLSHVMIFLTSGIFFYKWIILNLAIIAGLATIRRKVIPYRLAAMLAAIVVLAPRLFVVAELGWWDTRSVNHERFFAISEDGSEVEVPTNHWGSHAVIYAQMRIATRQHRDFFRTGTWGSTASQRVMERANRCALKLPEPGEVDRSGAASRHLANVVSRNVRNHHRHMLSRLDDQGRYRYELHPHHIWSVPWSFREFDSLDKRRIVAYRYVLEAVCLAYDNGQISRNVVRRADHVIGVDHRLDSL